MKTVEDTAKIFKNFLKYIPYDLQSSLHIDTLTIENPNNSSLNNKTFQVLNIDYLPEKMPFVSNAQYESDIIPGRIYTRRGTQSIEASYEEIQKIISTRIETGHSSTQEIELREELSELKILYQFSPKHIYSSAFNISELMHAGLGNKKEQNPHYPEENFDEFVSKLIEQKKRRIESTYVSIR